MPSHPLPRKEQAERILMHDLYRAILCYRPQETDAKPGSCQAGASKPIIQLDGMHVIAMTSKRGTVVYRSVQKPSRGLCHLASLKLTIDECQVSYAVPM